MFESTATLLNAEEFDPAWRSRDPVPGTAAHDAYLVYEAQQIAFWNAYSAAVPVPGERLNLNAARSDAGLLDEITRRQEQVNAAEGAKLRAIADFANRRIANPEVGYDARMMAHDVEAEVGCALRIPPSTASSVVHLALTFTQRLPQTFEALQRGELTKTAAEMIADETANLNVAQCARLEKTVLPDAGSRSYRSLRNKVRRTVEKLDADAVRKRKQQALEDRCVYVKDEPDGMATLCIKGPAEVIGNLFHALNDKVLAAQLAVKAEHTDAAFVLPNRDDRKVGAQRHDAIVDILGAALNVDPWTPTVTQSSFLTDEQIAHLDRHGDTYRPSEAMKRAVRNRDKHCRFPGCRRPARFCDVDHTIAFKIGGRTVYFNLGCVCRFHHQVKQLPGWHLEQDRGRFIWTTPNGMRFITYPPSDDGDEPADFASYNPNEPIPF